MERERVPTTYDRFIIDDEELEFLKRYDGQMADRKDSHRYDNFTHEQLVRACRRKDDTNDLLLDKADGAREVIDVVARALDIADRGYNLYYLTPKGNTPLVTAMADLVQRSGDKAKLKKRITELETENELLKSLVQVKGDVRRSGD